MINCANFENIGDDFVQRFDLERAAEMFGLGLGSSPGRAACGIVKAMADAALGLMPLPAAGLMTQIARLHGDSDTVVRSGMVFDGCETPAVRQAVVA